MRESSVHFPNCWERSFANGWSKILTIFSHCSPRDEKRRQYNVLSVSHRSGATVRLEDRDLTMRPDRSLDLRGRQKRSK
ncbi:hypothetical protein TNCV_1428011 [Trichonephila clavipes]|nr:hypothetical protein TNCV_1428011 [Trichonephila clavipes]